MRYQRPEPRKTDRTLVKINSVGKTYVTFRTVSMDKSSADRFFVERKKLINYISRHDIFETYHDSNQYSTIKAKFGDYKSKSTIIITFTWLNGTENDLSGYQETVELYLAPLYDWLWKIEKTDDDLEYKDLNIIRNSQPKITFTRTENLRHVIRDKRKRRCLTKFLRSELTRWNTREIRIYNDFEKNSFGFSEIKADGTPGTIGGIIYHSDPKNPRNTKYAIHT